MSGTVDLCAAFGGALMAAGIALRLGSPSDALICAGGFLIGWAIQSVLRD